MAKQWSVSTPRQTSSGRTSWIRVGTGWSAKGENPGVNILLDALPLPDKDGRVSLIVREDRPRDQRQQPRREEPRREEPRRQEPREEPVDGFDDDDPRNVPF